MKMAKRLISVVLVVLMLLSMSVVAASAYTVPDGFEVTDKEATEINGQVYGRIGDTDMNDTVNVRDATLIQKSAADLAVLDDVQKVLADVNFDGKVNVRDATAVQKFVADIETKEPINQIIYIPEVTEPETTAPVETEPVETEPVETEPEATTPDETEPVETEPEATTPDETEPAETEPVETEPVETEPAATTPDETEPVETEPVETEPEVETITIYFSNNNGWENVYIYGFYGVEGGEATGEPLGAYPGTKMTFVEKNGYGQDIYSAEVPADIDYIKFADGTASNNRTNNIPKTEIADNAGFYITDNLGGTKWGYGTYEYAPSVPEDTTAPVETEPVETEPVETEPVETEPVETEPVETQPAGVTVYAVNSAKWDTVCAYYWGGADVAWPGTAMTKTGDTVNGFDVYSITLDKAPENIIFNNNNNGSQTGDLTFQAGQYFDVKSGKWYASLKDIPEVSKLSTDRYLVGSFNNWSTTANEFTISAEGETVAYVELELEANTTYEFKIVREGKWTSCKTTLNITDSAEGLTFSSSVSGNTMLVTKAAGTYVFAFGLETSQLSVTYPK